MKKPTIGKSTSKDPELQRILTAVKELIEVREGDRGDPKDAFVSFRDLVDAELVDFIGPKSAQISSRPSISVVPVASASYTPTTPGGFTDIIGGFTTILLKWAAASYSGHDHTEIHRSESNDRSTAGIVGMAGGSMFSDPVDYNQTFYYWMRFVASDGTVGNFNSTEGTLGQTSKSVEDVIAETGNKLGVGAFSQFVLDTLRGPKGDDGDDGVTTTIVQNTNTDVPYTGYSTTVSSNGYITGLTNYIEGATGTSKFYISASDFAIVDPSSLTNYHTTDAPAANFPFSVVNGVTTINDAWIDYAHIANLTAQQIDTTNLNVGGAFTAWSGDINALTAGVISDDNNRFVIDFNKGTLLAFDDAGNLRVKVGDLGGYTMGTAQYLSTSDTYDIIDIPANYFANINMTLSDNALVRDNARHIELLGQTQMVYAFWAMYPPNPTGTSNRVYNLREDSTALYNLASANGLSYDTSNDIYSDFWNNVAGSTDAATLAQWVIFRNHVKSTTTPMVDTWAQLMAWLINGAVKVYITTVPTQPEYNYFKATYPTNFTSRFIFVDGTGTLTL